MNSANDIISKLPPPKFLNLEYLFAKFFELAKRLFFFIIYLFKHLGNFMIYNFALIFSFILALVGAVILYKLYKLKKKQRVVYSVKFAEEEKEPKKRSSRWDAVKKRINSQNPDDWKMAIVEADTILEDLFRGMGYRGDSFGEILKNINPNDFTSLQEIWDAHKARNRIAHPEEGFQLTQRMAEEAVRNFEKALKELGYL